MGHASEFFWLMALWRLERAAVQFYRDALRVSPRTLNSSLIGCKRSHEWRALYLWDWLRKLGAIEQPSAVATHLYGMEPGTAWHDPTLLLWTLHEGEHRGRAMYERLSESVGGTSQAMVLQYLDPEQERVAHLTQALLTQNLCFQDATTSRVVVANR